ncbi:MAG: hypothetical protein RIM84_09505 [Alphaproteobacteria bacterium]
MIGRAVPLGAALLGAVLLVSACGFGPGARIGQAVLRSGDIERQVSNRTFAGETTSGAPIEVFFHTDGVVYIRGEGSAGIPFQDRGRWWVQWDRLCTRYERVRGRKATCEWVTLEGRDFRTYTPAGDLSARGEIYEGAPRGIERRPAKPPTVGS